MFTKILFQILFAGVLVSVAAQKNLNGHWEAIPNLDGTVDFLTVSGNDLYVGGLFETINGDSNASHIAKWNGTSWDTLGSGLDNWCTSIAILGNDLYAMGFIYKSRRSAQYLIYCDVG